MAFKGQTLTVFFSVSENLHAETVVIFNYDFKLKVKEA